MHPVFRSVLPPLLGSLALMLCASSHAAEPLPVTASFSILGDLVRVVGGERVTVTNLVGPNEDAHVFEPKPTHLKNLLKSRLLVTNGLGFEPWADKLVKASGYRGKTVVASNGVAARTMRGTHQETDPHAWQDPQNVVRYVRNIAAALAEADPAGASQYQANAQAYTLQLQTLDSWAAAQFAGLPHEKRKVITAHDAFGYFAARYQIRFLAPQGMSTEATPSAKAVGQLVRQMQREKIKAVFLENMSDPKLLAQLARDTGVTVGPSLYADALSGPNELGGSYLQMVRHNVTHLAAGMAMN